jgi:hypothetical protein
MNKSETVVDLIQTVLYSDSCHRYLSSIDSRQPLKLLHRVQEAEKSKSYCLAPSLKNVKIFSCPSQPALLITLSVLSLIRQPLRFDGSYDKKIKAS